MTQALRKLETEHGRIRAMLTQFETQLDLFERAEQPDYEILGGSVAYCREYLDCWHHAREDALLERLRERNPQAAHQCAELEAQHAGLADVTHELVTLFEAVREGATVEREGLVRRARNLAGAYHLHLAWEEAHFFPAVEKALRPEDWAAIDARFAAADDPLATNPVDERYRPLFGAIADAQTAETARAG
jgi:hemerythrin-like domain-containing protein